MAACTGTISGFDVGCLGDRAWPVPPRRAPVRELVESVKPRLGALVLSVVLLATPSCFIPWPHRVQRVSEIYGVVVERDLALSGARVWA